jgi:hypothetical protein
VRHRHSHSNNNNGNHNSNNLTSQVQRTVGHRKDSEKNDGTLNNLVAVHGGPAPNFKTTNRDWHLDVATLLDARSQTSDPETTKLLELTMLHSYYKAAAIDKAKAADQGRQISPFLEHSYRYHRSVDNMLNYQAHVAYEQALGFRQTLDTKMVSYETRFVHLVSNDTFSEVMSREYNTPDISPSSLAPSSMDEFKSALGEMFGNVSRLPQAPANSKVMFDVSSMLAPKLAGIDPKDTASTVGQLAGEMEQAFTDKLTEYVQAKDQSGWLPDDPQGGPPTDDQQQAARDAFLGNMSRVARGTQIMGFTEDQGNTVMMTPQFLNAGLPPSATPEQQTLLGDALRGPSSYGELRKEVDETIKQSGYRLDPASAMNAWLSNESVESIFQRHDFKGSTLRDTTLPLTTLATKGEKLASSFDSFQDLTGSNIFQKFEAMASNPALSDKPYVSVLTKATAEALKGLGQENSAVLGSIFGDGGFSAFAQENPSFGATLGQRDIDKAFSDKGLSGLLQTSYFRMANAMAEATSFPGDFFHFSNQIELIHQQMSMLLTVTQPYKDGDFSTALLDHMKGTIPESLAPMTGAQLYPSAMHTAATTLSSVEAQKGSNDLTVAVLKDSYYETSGSDPGHSGIVFRSKVYDAWQVDGDTLGNKAPISDGSLTSPKNGDNLQGFKDSGKKLDVFIADFRHNISPTRQVYGIEDLSHQVDQLYGQGLVQKHFTVAIDNTIDTIQSSDVKGFLDHNRARIQNGDLNVVIFRSAQKFDMLGIDNYYGGYAVTVNNPSSFKGFNDRMFDPRDQLGGLNRQGLTHLMTTTPKGLDAYRAGIMQNTKTLFDRLPDGLKFDPNAPPANPAAPTRPSDLVAVSRIEGDDKQVFLDIKFPAEALQSQFELSLIRYATTHNLPVDQRSSFGFATSNLTVIPGVGVRFNPGLEDAATIKMYAAFFQQWNDIIVASLPTGGRPGDILFELAKAFPPPQL